MIKRRILYAILAILSGAFLFVYGEFDDSPGGQLLGLVLVIIGIVGVIKSNKKTHIKRQVKTPQDVGLFIWSENYIINNYY